MEKELENIIANTISEKQINEDPAKAKAAAKLMNALREYAKAAKLLSYTWVDAQDVIEDEEWCFDGSKDLPFNSSFDEHSYDITKWVDGCLNRLRNIK